MEIALLLKVVGIGLLVAVSNQILSKTGRDEIATWITVGGIVLVLILLIGQIGALFSSIRSLFGI
ncbi:MAG: stage III sporulation protein AC [Clostridia bacterium]|nr:stage III sporulation protein AC [Clostridia bacterium]